MPTEALKPSSRVLEIGGGIGALQAEAILSGAGSGEVIELVGAYRPYAQRLAAELGIEGRSVFRVRDLLQAGVGAASGVVDGAAVAALEGVVDGAAVAAVDGAAVDVQPADVVLMHRVICCSPDGLELTEVASRLARRALVLSFPRYTVPARAVARVQDLVFRLLGRSYRLFVRPAEAIVARAEANGLRVVARGHDLVWTFVALERRSVVASE
ncbi:MAG: hypothetical protein R6W77_15705 [Trueperaceae bacterium]